MRRLILFFSLTAFLFACSDPCADVNCGANGTCDEETGSCICDPWFEGTNCEIETRGKFLGTWNSTSNCNLGNNNTDPTWTLSSGPTPEAFILQSVDVLSNRIIEATLTSDTEATITSFMAGETTFTGNIAFVNDTRLVMDINFVNSMQNVDCSYSMER